ncbi:MAG TPA: PCYCGC motif-containing (lipo)protein [Thermodesulfobacteriota bacterium]|nr:PCYCGC motif-containing (lipo)protein [Thermodesulfobacteriota bacterium]
MTCYVTEHGAECDICIDEAIRAYELYKEGKDTLTIRKTIDKEFSRFSH